MSCTPATTQLRNRTSDCGRQEALKDCRMICIRCRTSLSTEYGDVKNASPQLTLRDQEEMRETLSSV